jgi:hypothetical protein
MRDLDSLLDPEQRLQEIAAILAAGVLRLRSRVDLGDLSAWSHSSGRRLEDAAANSLTGHAGSRAQTRRTEAA